MHPRSRFTAALAAGIITLTGPLAATALPRASAAVAPGQPYAPNWFPAELLAWAPERDADAPFNRSTTPLAGRVSDSRTQADPAARRRQVMALSVFGDTDGNPAQGSAGFDYYTAEHWQYLDTLVFWGGSASEGLILAPNPTVTDAAHRNGVPVLGTVFFPPAVYGGRLDWVREFLARDATGGFPMVAKLAEAARYYGFDGWFVNQETEGADAAMATAMKEFLAALRATGVKVLWYDSMIDSGEIRWQGALNAANENFYRVSDLMFLDYRWTPERLRDSAAHARSLGRDPADLHAGVDVGWRQFTAQNSVDAIAASDLSIALYRPDFTLTGTDDRSAYAARDTRFWVGADRDPAAPTPDAEGWRGLSAEVAEATPVTSVPFVTHFDTGRGHLYAREGRRWQRGDWNNLSAQDVLPTWRWIVRGAALTAGLDYGEAYTGGSSLRLTGRLDRPTTLPLYATRVRIDARTRLEMVAKGLGGYDAVLRFADRPAEEVAVRLRSEAGWTRSAASLARHAGRTLISVGIRVSGRTRDLDGRLGRLALLGATTPRPTPVSGVRVDGGRVTWPAATPPPARYQIEASLPDGSRRWLGATTATAYYAPAVPEGARVTVFAD